MDPSLLTIATTRYVALAAGQACLLTQLGPGDVAERDHDVRPARIVVACCGLLTASVACRDARVRHAPLEPSVLRRVDSVAAVFMDRRSVPGLSIAVASYGRLLYARGYGVAALSGERAGPVTPRTVFELGSIKKPITAAVVLQLAERGLVGLDDPAGRWIGRIRTEGPPVRVRDMLNQVSGLPDVDDTATVRALDFEPRSRWAYRNANFDLLDLLVEKATGQHFRGYLKDSMMDPLGLYTLAMCDPENAEEGEMAQGYTRRGGALQPVADPCWLRGTPSDLALWADALFEGRIVGRAELAEMTTAVTLKDGTQRDYGFGLRLRPHRGVERLSHTGHVDGFAASFGYYPKADLAVAVAGNSDSLFDPDAVEVAIGTVLMGMSPLEPEVVSAGNAERFRGVYDAGDVWFRVGGAGGDSLTLSMTPPEENATAYFATRLMRVGETWYVGADSPDVIEVRFLAPGSTEVPDGAVVDVVGIPWEATRRVSKPSDGPPPN